MHAEREISDRTIGYGLNMTARVFARGFQNPESAHSHDRDAPSDPSLTPV